MAFLVSPLLLCPPSKPPVITVNHFFKPKPPILNYSSEYMKPLFKYKDLVFFNNQKKSKTRVVISSSSILGEANPKRESYRIWWSDVVVKKPKNVFIERKWDSLDFNHLIWAVITHGLALFGPFTFSWAAFWVAFLLYLITGMLGITLCYHRNLAHRSFKLPKWLEYFFAYCGVLALQGDPMWWVSIHRYHHQYCDTEKDPHSPLEGFWFSHFYWMLDNRAIIEKCGGLSNVGDLEKQPFYRFIRKTYFLHSLALGILLYALGGFPYLVWGMGIRTTLVYHITFFVNSASHVWGNQAWNTGDLSRNNWWVALLAFGEGWHNNHHAFEYSARHGLEWWQVDVTWYVIKLLQAIGLAKDVMLPTEAHKQRLAFKVE